MSTSSIGRYIDALLAALRARPGLQAADVLISDGLPWQNLAGVRLISIGGQSSPTVEGEQRTAQLGAQRREEEYQVRVFCSAQTGGTDQKLVRDQALALMAEVEDTLRGGAGSGDPTLGGVVRESYVQGAVSLTQTGPPGPDDDSTKGRWCEVAFDITVRNRI